MKGFLFFLLVLTNSVFAQFKQKETYTVYVNYPDHTIKATVSNKIVKTDAKETLSYHWYASNKIIETKGGYDGKILDGSYTSFYLSNNLKEKGSFKKGLKDGKWMSWYDNGKLKEISNWKRGMKSGQFKIFMNDTLVSESYYKNDVLKGIQTIYENGKVIRRVKYKNGKEIVPKPKKEKSKKETKENTDKKSATDKPKKTFKEKINSLFRKEQIDSDKEQVKETEKNKNPVVKDEKQKKTLKEKFASIFKKKGKFNKTDIPAEPKKNTKQAKPQAVAK